MKRVLIDTQAFIAIRAGKMSPKSRRAFLDEEVELFLSVASVWEMQIKMALRKLEMSVSLKDAVESAFASGHIKQLPLQLEHIYALDTLPFHHRDPFDRIIIAQALLEKMEVISNDRNFDAYGIRRIN